MLRCSLSDNKHYKQFMAHAEIMFSYLSLLGICSTASCCCDALIFSNLGKKWFILAHSLRYSLAWQESQGRSSLMQPGRFMSSEEKNKKCQCLAHCLHFRQHMIFAQGMASPIVSVSLHLKYYNQDNPSQLFTEIHLAGHFRFYQVNT